MRSLIITTLLLGGFAHAVADDYVENRELSLDAAGIDALFIDTDAGSLQVKGEAGRDLIEVRARIVIPDADADEGGKVVAKSLRLALDRDANVARLDAVFERGFWGFGAEGRIDLEISVPAAMNLDVDDGSGPIEIRSVDAEVNIDDGSGSIQVSDAAAVYVDDGSGSIDIDTVAGDVVIDDGSGRIRVEHVGGSVTIDDGSGDIDVSDVEMDVIITNAGSGGVRLRDVRGRVEQDD